MSDDNSVRRTSKRERRKPQVVYDLSSLAPKEQRKISQASAGDGGRDEEGDEEKAEQDDHEEEDDEEEEDEGEDQEEVPSSGGDGGDPEVVGLKRRRRGRAAALAGNTGSPSSSAPSRAGRGKAASSREEEEEVEPEEETELDAEGGKGEREGKGEEQATLKDREGAEGGVGGDEEEVLEPPRKRSTRGGKVEDGRAVGNNRASASSGSRGRGDGADGGQEAEGGKRRGVPEAGSQGRQVGEENSLMVAVRRNGALAAVVGDWVSGYDKSSRRAMGEMVNFVLLAAGAPCSQGPYTAPKNVQLSDMDAEHWAAFMEKVNADMQKASAGATSSFPLAPPAKGKAGKSARNFRSNFGEVFQRMTEACRRGAGHKIAPLTAVSNALVMLSQQELDDVRLAATLAAMQLGLGVAEGLADLHTKLAVAKRQLDGATGNKGRGRSGASGSGADKTNNKTKSLTNQVNRLTSAMETLTEISDAIQSKVVHKRYRDVSATVRAAIIEGLTGIMLALPEVFVQDRLMRYLGWSLSDKAAGVRSSSLQAMQRLLANEAVSPKLGKFFGHFFGRIKTMLLDIDDAVCREAAAVLRLLLAAGFLEGMQEEDAMEVESNIFEAGLPLAAKAECMGFFVDRLEEFVETDVEKASTAGSKGGRGKGAKAQAPKTDEDEQLSLVRLESLVQLISIHAEASLSRKQHVASADGDKERFACADAAVQALWQLPQAPVLRRWRALCKLLDNEEAGGGDGNVSGTGEATKGALDGREQTIAARVLLTSVKMTASEANTGRRANGQALSKDTKQELRESISELTEACLTHLPNLLAKYQSDDAKLALLSELPVFLPRKALASLVSGTGKGAFSDLLSRTKNAFLMSTSPPVIDAAASSLQAFLAAEHAKRAEVEAVIQDVFQELSSKACALCQEDEEGVGGRGEESKGEDARSPRMTRRSKRGSEDRSWKDLGTALGLCLRRLRSLLGAVDPSVRMDSSEKDRLWSRVKGAIDRRCHLDQVLTSKTLSSQQGARLDIARKIVEEGCNVLYTLFLWRMKSVFSHLKMAARRGRVEDERESAHGGEADEEGDDKDVSPEEKEGVQAKGKGRTRAEDEEELFDGDGVGAGEELTEATVEAVADQRDGLVDILRSMLSMHLHPSDSEVGSSAGESKEGDGDVEDGTEGAQRALTLEQKARMVEPVRRAAWFISHELQTLLKAFLGRVEGPASVLTWQPDASFTRLLQQHFETQEEALIASLTERRDEEDRKAKRGAMNRKAGAAGQNMEEDSDEDKDGVDDEEEEHDDNEEKYAREVEEAQGAGELLLPIMKSILSNADRLNRRQAAAVVSHVVHSSAAAGALAKCFLSKLKEYNPIRCLQVHIATLQVYYERWVAAPSRGQGDGGEEQREDGDEDGEEGEGDEDERRWKREEGGLEHWIPLANRLSMSLGIGSLRTKDLSEQKSLQDSFLLFMKELVRFAFAPDGERLLFLEGVREYTSKLTPRQKKILANFMDQQAKNLESGVLSDGRERAQAWDLNQSESTMPPRWRAFFNLRNSLSQGSAASFLPEAQRDVESASPSVSVGSSSSARQGAIGSGAAALSTPAAKASVTARLSDEEGSSRGTPAPGTPGRAPGSGESEARQQARVAMRGGRRTGSLYASAGSHRSRVSVASDLFPVAEETELQEVNEEDSASGEKDAGSKAAEVSSGPRAEEGLGGEALSGRGAEERLGEEPPDLGGGEQAEEGDGQRFDDDGKSVVSEVHTPNKRPLGGMEGVGGDEEGLEDEADGADVLEELAFDAQRASPSSPSRDTVSRATKRSRIGGR